MVRILRNKLNFRTFGYFFPEDYIKYVDGSFQIAGL